jgi:fructose-1,6-bisphosphatase/sedoheptulose 1,7-bisphosphatase-like protein
LRRKVSDLVVIVLDRPRHEKLMDEIRRAGARIRLISDGDLSAGISAAVRGTNVHAVMGTGGAPEGVLTAAALRCLNGGMEGRLVPAKPGAEERQKFEQRLRKMGINDPNRIYTEQDLAPGEQIIFAASGVTDGTILRGVRFFGHGHRTHSVVISLRDRIVRWLGEVATRGVPIVGVTHKGVLRAVLAAATGWDMMGKPPVRLQNGALHRFDVDSRGRISVLECNVPLVGKPGIAAT